MPASLATPTPTLTRTRPVPVAPANPARPRPTTDFTGLPLGRRATWVVLLGSLTALGAFTVDLYLPAFPTLSRDFAVPAATVQLTLTGSLAGVAVGQLVVGPLSDALGRRRPLLAGLGLHLLASAACALAPSIGVLGALRVLQGLGVSAAAVTAQAIVRDRFSGSGAAKLLARLMLVIGVSPILAPSLGSALLGTVHWRGIFVVLGLLSLSLGIAVAAVLPETLPPRRRLLVSPRTIAGAYRSVLTDRAVVGLVAIAGLVMAAVFGYVANSSFVFLQTYHLPAAGYAVVFAIGGACLVTGSQLNGSLVHRVSSKALLTAGLLGGVAGAVVITLTAGTGAGGLAGLLPPVWVTMSFIGLAMPNPPVMALERHPEASGTTAAVVGAAQNGVAALASPLLGALGASALVSMTTTMVVSLAGALLVLLLVVTPALHRSAQAAR